VDYTDNRLEARFTLELL